MKWISLPDTRHGAQLKWIGVRLDGNGCANALTELRRLARKLLRLTAPLNARVPPRPLFPVFPTFPRHFPDFPRLFRLQAGGAIRQGRNSTSKCGNGAAVRVCFAIWRSHGSAPTSAPVSASTSASGTVTSCVVCLSPPSSPSLD